jgi:hypothetical protein
MGAVAEKTGETGFVLRADGEPTALRRRHGAVFARLDVIDTTKPDVIIVTPAVRSATR